MPPSVLSLISYGRVRKNWSSGWAGYCLICSSCVLGVGAREGCDCEAGFVGTGTGACEAREVEVKERADVPAADGETRNDRVMRPNMALADDDMLVVTMRLYCDVLDDVEQRDRERE